MYFTYMYIKLRLGVYTVHIGGYYIYSGAQTPVRLSLTSSACGSYCIITGVNIAEDNFYYIMKMICKHCLVNVLNIQIVLT